MVDRKNIHSYVFPRNNPGYRMLSRDLENMKVKQFDLLEPFKQASTREPLYKPNDTHWNIAGNKLAAEVIGNHISNAILTNCRGNDRH